MAVVAPQLSQLSQLNQLNQLNQDGHQVRGVKLDNFTLQHSLYFFLILSTKVIRPNMCLQISNSCHTQVTLSSRPFNIALGKSSKAQISFTQIFHFQEQLNRSTLIFVKK